MSVEERDIDYSKITRATAVDCLDRLIDRIAIICKSKGIIISEGVSIQGEVEEMTETQLLAEIDRLGQLAQYVEQVVQRSQELSYGAKVKLVTMAKQYGVLDTSMFVTREKW